MYSTIAKLLYVLVAEWSEENVQFIFHFEAATSVSAAQANNNRILHLIIKFPHVDTSSKHADI